MYKVVTKDGELYYTTLEEAQKMARLLNGKIVPIH